MRHSKRCAGLVLIALAVLLVAPRGAWSQGSDRAADRLLSSIPGEAWAVLCVPSLAELDGKVVALGQRLNLPVPGPVGMAKMQLGLVEGVDDAGGLAVVLMPLPDMSAPGEHVVILVPTTNMEALVQGMSPEAVGEGIQKVMFMERESYVTRHGERYAAFAQTADALKSFKAAKGNVRGEMAEQEVRRAGQDDVTLWVNIGAITSSEMYAPLEAMLAMSGQDPKQMKELASGQVGLRLDDKGITGGMLMNAKPESETAKLVRKVRTSEGSLLVGLPAEGYVLAMGSVMGPEQSAMAAESLDHALGNPMVTMQLGPQFGGLLNSIRPMVKESMASLRDLSFSVTMLPPGGDGLIGMAKVVRTAGDTEQLRGHFQTALTSLKGALAGIPETAEFAELVAYQKEVEQAAGVDVDKLVLSLPEDVPAETKQMLEKIVGAEGICFRIAVVDEDTMVSTFGGGVERLEQVIDAARRKQAPLSGDAGIKRVSGYVPGRKSTEGYLALDQLARLVLAIGEAVGEAPPFPINVPEVNAPITFVLGPAGKTGTQWDLYIPMETLVAAKDVGMIMMSAGQGAPMGGRPMEN